MYKSQTAVWLPCGEPYLLSMSRVGKETEGEALSQMILEGELDPRQLPLTTTAGAPSPTNRTRQKFWSKSIMALLFGKPLPLSGPHFPIIS